MISFLNQTEILEHWYDRIKMHFIKYFKLNKKQILNYFHTYKIYIFSIFNCITCLDTQKQKTSITHYD